MSNYPKADSTTDITARGPRVVPPRWVALSLRCSAASVLVLILAAILAAHYYKPELGDTLDEPVSMFGLLGCLPAILLAGLAVACARRVSTAFPVSRRQTMTISLWTLLLSAMCLVAAIVITFLIIVSCSC